MWNRRSVIVMASVALALVVAGTSIAEETCDMHGVWHIVIYDPIGPPYAGVGGGLLIIYREADEDRFAWAANAPLIAGYEEGERDSLGALLGDVTTGSVELDDQGYSVGMVFTPDSPPAIPVDMGYDPGQSCDVGHIYFGSKALWGMSMRLRAIRIAPARAAGW